MRYFVLYDSLDNPVRTATASETATGDVRILLANGFIEVVKDVYDSIVGTVKPLDVAAIGGAIAAGGLLARLLTARPRPKPVPPPPPQLVEKLTAQFRELVQRHTENYLSGEMTLNQWYSIMGREVRKLHLAAAAIGAGGWANLGGRAMEEALSEVREHIDFLDRFRQKIQDALDAGQPFSDKMILARAKMYGEGARATVEKSYVATLGLPRLPAYPGKATKCRSRCKCSWAIEQLPLNGNWDCYWERSPVESCANCIARERAFNPLRIRNGIIQPYPRGGLYR